MAFIGVDTATTSSEIMTSSTSPRMCITSGTYTAGADEIVDQVSVYNYVAGTGCTVGVGIYNITGLSLPTVTLATRDFYQEIVIATQAGSTWYSETVNWNLVSGQTYALAIAAISGSFRGARTGFASGNSNDSTSPGVLPASWTHSSYSYKMVAYANTTTASGSSIVPNTSNIMNMMRG